MEVEVDPSLSLPIETGQSVGVVVATRGEREVGEVPLVASESVAAAGTVTAAPRDEPWWRSLWEAFSGLYGRVQEILTD